MKYVALVLFFVGLSIATASELTSTPTPKAPPAPKAPPPNPNIDMDGYLRVSGEAAKQRATHRVSEEDFIKMSAEPNTIVLDARSKEKYDLLHIKGAINLSFPDIDVESLKRVLPDKKVRLLIYCNNNFQVVPEPLKRVQQGAQGPNVLATRAFPPKMATASLNLSTYIALYNYGYTNVYELAPLLDPEKSKLAFESNAVKK